MTSGGKELRDRLLGRVAPAAESFEKYRKEVAVMIEEKEKRLRREKRLSSLMWVFVVVLSTSFLVLGGVKGGEEGLWFGIQACFWFAFGAVFLFRYFLNRNNLEMLKELKGLEMTILEGRADRSCGPRES